VLYLQSLPELARCLDAMLTYFIGVLQHPPCAVSLPGVERLLELSNCDVCLWVDFKFAATFTSILDRYEIGEGVERDLGKAFAWYTLASRSVRATICSARSVPPCARSVPPIAQLGPCHHVLITFDLWFTPGRVLPPPAWVPRCGCCNRYLGALRVLHLLLVCHSVGGEPLLGCHGASAITAACVPRCGFYNRCFCATVVRVGLTHQHPSN
jgi:hypothetical protein